MTADPRADVALLDELEAARAAATPGPWAEWDSAVVNPATPARDVFVECDHRADAACIVAEHNAAGRLVAALRGVLAYADLLSRTAGQRPEPLAIDVAWAIRDAIRHALTAPLGHGDTEEEGRWNARLSAADGRSLSFGSGGFVSSTARPPSSLRGRCSTATPRA